MNKDEKIIKNAQEDETFCEMLKLFINGDEKISNPLVIGETPYSLYISGASKEIDIIITPKTLLKCISEPSDRYHGHGLNREILEQIPKELRCPVMVLKGSRDDSLVVITKMKDKESRFIIIAISLDELNKRHEVNRVSSIYGKDNIKNYLDKQVNQGNLISYNKNEADRMLQSLGLQLPPEETYISFNNSIAYSLESVNGFFIENKENISVSKNKPLNLEINNGFYISRQSGGSFTVSVGERSETYSLNDKAVTLAKLQKDWSVNEDKAERIYDKASEQNPLANEAARGREADKTEKKENIERPRSNLTGRK